MLGLITELSQEYDAFISRYKSIKLNRDHSVSKIDALRHRLAAMSSDIPPEVKLVAIAGSYARHDASSESDVDLMIFSDSVSNKSVANFQSEIYEVCAELGMPKPNPKGVFAQPISIETMVQVSGDMNERYVDLSQRLLLLLESKHI